MPYAIAPGRYQTMHGSELHDSGPDADRDSQGWTECTRKPMRPDR